jgi:hypothetical protein
VQWRVRVGDNDNPTLWLKALIKHGLLEKPAG